MISALHLIWIIPASTLFGFVICAVLGANDRFEEEDSYEE